MAWPKDPRQIALLHDWLTGFRGGERVFEAFCELFPGSPVYTLLSAPGTTCDTIESHPIHASFLNRLPGIERHYRKFLPVFPLAAQSIKIPNDVKLVLSSSHCVIKGVKKPKDAVHVSYIYSPMRYMYDQYDQYFGADSPLLQRTGAKIFRNYITNWDKASNANVDVMVAISKFVRDRIRKFYNRDAEVIYPFVDLADFVEVQKNKPATEDYFVMVSAFAPNKRVDLAITACESLGKKLKIIGGGQLEHKLKSMAGKNTEFLGTSNRKEVIETIAKAKALIFPGVEDFGIVPLESLAAGTPVIAYKAGGVLETLTEEDTIFFNDPTEKSLKQALQLFETTTLKINQPRLQKFSKPRFQSEIKSLLQSTVDSKKP